MEIERKFLVKDIPYDLGSLEKKEITQGYLCTDPVLRIRRTDDRYTLTYKGGGLIAREEYDLPFSKEGYDRLIAHVEGIVLEKTRYLIPIDKYTIELDVFHGAYEGLIVAEVEFPNMDECEAFVPPSWFKEDVSEDGRYHNSRMCLQGGIDKMPGRI